MSYTDHLFRAKYMVPYSTRREQSAPTSYASFAWGRVKMSGGRLCRRRAVETPTTGFKVALGMTIPPFALSIARDGFHYYLVAVCEVGEGTSKDNLTICHKSSLPYPRAAMMQSSKNENPWGRGVMKTRRLNRRGKRACHERKVHQLR